MSATEAFDAAVRRHDALIAALGLEIWAGSEPTFTDRYLQTPEWISAALGGDKERRAEALVAGLAQRFPAGMVLRSVGRQYPGEDRPRWNLGLYRRRDGIAFWHGPPDPLLGTGHAPGPADLDTWAIALSAALRSRAWRVCAVDAVDPTERRLLLTRDSDTTGVDCDPAALARPSVHDRSIPTLGLRDELAESGMHLFVLRHWPFAGQSVARVELPAFSAVATFMVVLEALAEASRDCGLTALVVAGYPPPVDTCVEWTTVTPDPAVIEINTAPSVDAEEFLGRSREIYAAAADQGLAPYRLYFSGIVADSGGGGQITLGAATPAASPFLREPHLLPRLVRYFNRHPALSYLYAHDYVGGSGQAVRADERGADAFAELKLTLSLLTRLDAPSPDLLWHSLAPFLCDGAGNAHRAEINIEKLCNPYLAGRGRLGLVEFRALRMQHAPERATALVCLLRAVVAMLVRGGDMIPVVDWGRELHTRFALPFYLEQDIEGVLGELVAAGVGVDEPIRDFLLLDEFRYWGSAAVPGCTLEVRQAVEFWPLLGDASSPEQGGGSRLVDASTSRVELRLRPDDDAAVDWGDWEVQAFGESLPMRLERDRRGPVKVYGLRYRSFVPACGLHPALPPQVPMRLHLRHAGRGVAYAVTLHDWRPDGSAYDGLPTDLAAAAERRAQRIRIEPLPDDDRADPGRLPRDAIDPYGVDLRWILR